jgi:hypothetical protein
MACGAETVSHNVLILFYVGTSMMMMMMMTTTVVVVLMIWIKVLIELLSDYAVSM